jgi:hypothetical protein
MREGVAYTDGGDEMRECVPEISVVSEDVTGEERGDGGTPSSCVEHQN